MRSATGRVGLSMVLVLILYSFGENLEVLTYLCWPAFVILGVTMRASVPEAITLQPD
ncbi:MAG: hypothetical protein RL481_965, partial [Pseudomonadota bacterium]